MRVLAQCDITHVLYVLLTSLSWIIYKWNKQSNQPLLRFQNIYNLKTKRSNSRTLLKMFIIETKETGYGYIYGNVLVVCNVQWTLCIIFDVPGILEVAIIKALLIVFRMWLVAFVPILHIISINSSFPTLSHLTFFIPPLHPDCTFFVQFFANFQRFSTSTSNTWRVFLFYEVFPLTCEEEEF